MALGLWLVDTVEGAAVSRSTATGLLRFNRTEEPTEYMSSNPEQPEEVVQEDTTP